MTEEILYLIAFLTLFLVFIHFALVVSNKKYYQVKI